MGKLIDLTGQRFGRLTVIERAENKGKFPMWLCRCDCGNTKEISGSSLRKGLTLSCGCYNREIKSDKVIDLTGQRFGRLVVVEQAGKKNRKIMWKCACDCGKTTIVTGNSLKSGGTKSCGCYALDCKKMGKKENLIGRRFGRLTVIGEAEKSNKQIMWLCKCDCGNTKVVSARGLRGGSTKSCGCYAMELKKSGRFIDLTGQRFGNLTVVERVEINNRTKWRCLCDCGNEKIASTGGLRSNTTKTCGYCNPKKKRYTKEQLIELLKKYVKNNGFPTNEREDFNLNNGLPSASTFSRAFGGNIRDWLSLCGCDINEYEKYLNMRRVKNQRSKEECVNIIMSMQNALDRPLMYDDFRNPTKDTIGITDVRRYWGSLNKMKAELGLEINQDSMVEKSLTRDGLDRELGLICDELCCEGRDFVSTREINKFPFCSNYYSLHKACLKYYGKGLVDILSDKGISLGKQGRGINHTFDDGEHTCSIYEYIFSSYLRDLRLEYGKDYVRDIKYSDFVQSYKGNMNCDYVICVGSRKIYIEIAGVLDNYKKWYYQDREMTDSESKELYRLKLKEKEKMLSTEGLEYYILFPCDLSKRTLDMILASEDSTWTRMDIEKFNKSNIEWDKVLENGELKYDYSRIGKDNQPVPIY